MVEGNDDPATGVEALLDDLFPEGVPEAARAKQTSMRSWSGRLLKHVASVLWLPSATEFEKEVLALRTSVEEYREELEAAVAGHQALYEELQVAGEHLAARWAAGLRFLAPQGVARRTVEQYRYLSVLMVQEKKLLADLEACAVDVLTSRIQATDDLLHALNADPTPALIAAVADAAWLSPAASLLETYLPHAALVTRHTHLTGAITRAYDAVRAPRAPTLGLLDVLRGLESAAQMDGSSATYLCQDASSRDAVASLLNRFRRCVGDTRTQCGRLLRRWADKLHADVETTVALDTSGANNTDGLDEFFVAHLAAWLGARDRAYAPAVLATRLPPAKALLAFERYFEARVRSEFGCDGYAPALRLGVHHAVFAAVAKVAAAYEVPASPHFSRHLLHLHHAHVDMASLGLPLCVVTNGASLPHTVAAVAAIAVEISPLGVVSAVLAAIHCLHAEMATLGSPHLNADLLIPLLVCVLAQADAPAVARRLQLAMTFAFGHVPEGSEAGAHLSLIAFRQDHVIAYYLTCMHAAVSVIGGDASACATCNRLLDGVALVEVPCHRPRPTTPVGNVAALSAWIQHHHLSEDTLELLEPWMA
ncbi:hypothetical protein ACHHYP_08074 [Achlya hypogyna]|uniref:Uncharacterized protein n=1 Tax=Achlya hypogyna TaxID=1202772 RepID=A0A1V9YPY3_ACHHY|nr:hypothetical protein ACHHYP_08074 [Achlya hypogyna]